MALQRSNWSEGVNVVGRRHPAHNTFSCLDKIQAFYLAGNASFCALRITVVVPPMQEVGLWRRNTLRLRLLATHGKKMAAMGAVVFRSQGNGFLNDGGCV